MMMQLCLCSFVFLSDLGSGLEVMSVSEYARLVVSQSRAMKKFLPLCEGYSWKILMMMVVLLLLVLVWGFFLPDVLSYQEVTGTLC